MSTRENIKQREHVIPHNVSQEGTMLSGYIKIRNAVEGVVTILPITLLLFLIYKVHLCSIKTFAILDIAFCAPLFLLCINGIAGESCFQFLMHLLRFRQSEKVLLYNPRIKEEFLPEYMIPKDETSKDKFRQVANEFTAKIAGDGGTIDEAITNPSYVPYFSEDSGIVIKPTELKTRADIKQENRRIKQIRKAMKKDIQSEMQICKQILTEERGKIIKSVADETRVANDLLSATMKPTASNKQKNNSIPEPNPQTSVHEDTSVQSPNTESEDVIEHSVLAVDSDLSAADFLAEVERVEKEEEPTISLADDNPVVVCKERAKDCPSIQKPISGNKAVAKPSVLLYDGGQIIVPGSGTSPRKEKKQ